MNEMPELQNRLKAAVRGTTAPPYLESRIRAHIRSTGSKRSWTLKWIPVAVAAAICLGLAIAYQLGHLRLTTASQEKYIASVSYKVATLMRVGLGDHVHCSVFRKFPKNPPKIEDLEQNLGPQYQGLIPIVRKRLPDDYRLMIAHQCSYHGRKFVHLSLQSDSQMVSLVIARKSEGESFETEGLLPELVASGIPIYRSGVQRFQMSAFESRDFLVYFISDLPHDRNVEVMTAMAPDIKSLLERI
jgi:hypothetical protein